jgi:mannose-1-phosphate guanylyltransferase/mannose-6-phosphate isomerase
MNAPTPNPAVAVTAAHNEERFAIILAGGSGTRLWPLSRASMPKQLLALNGAESLLQQTARRLLPLVSAAQVVTVTHNDHRFEVAGQLHHLQAGLAEHVLAEPIGRNTLPAIAWAVARIAARQPRAVIGVFSSDHAVADETAFQQAWLAAEGAAREGYLALFGMRPTEAATGYGYIQAGQALALTGATTLAARRVSRFVEKPDRATAEQFLRAGDYYWNAGMFVFRVDIFQALLERAQPVIAAAAQELAVTAAVSHERYAALPDLSIDYGLLEKHADRAVVVPVTMGWSDLGSWEAIYQQRDKDSEGNVTHGPILAIGSNNNLLWSEQGLVATLGLENMAVVQTRDATLIAPRERVADLKQLVGEVKRKDSRLTETHLTVARPWGSYTILEEGERYKIKRIVVHPGQKLSMQMHYHRSEHWVVIAGTAKITNGDQEIHLEENQSTYIPKTHRHRLENPGKIPLQIIEIQTGAYLEEDDIVRFGDVYGRA